MLKCLSIAEVAGFVDYASLTARDYLLNNGNWKQVSIYHIFQNAKLELKQNATKNTKIHTMFA